MTSRVEDLHALADRFTSMAPDALKALDLVARRGGLPGSGLSSRLFSRARSLGRSDLVDEHAEVFHMIVKVTAPLESHVWASNEAEDMLWYVWGGDLLPTAQRNALRTRLECVEAVLDALWVADLDRVHLFIESVSNLGAADASLLAGNVD